MTKILFLIDHYLVFVVVVVVVVVVDVFVVFVVAAAEFVAVISANVAVIVLAVFIFPAVGSDWEIDDGDSAVAWYFLEMFDYWIGDLGDFVELAICRLYLRVLVELAGFL